jgi:hypothetical protein
MKSLEVKHFIENKGELTNKDIKKIEDQLFLANYPEGLKDHNGNKIKIDIYSGLEDCVVYRPDGTPLCTVLRRHFTKETSYLYFKHNADKVVPIDMNRGDISGQKGATIYYADGTQSKNKKFGKAGSTITGFFDRAGRQNYCRKSANAKDPVAFKHAIKMAQEADSAFKKYAPLRYKNQKAITDMTDPNFVIPGTTFTTITMNRNFRTAGHRDSGDFPEGFGVMAYLQKGKILGGELCFPAWGIGLKLYNRDCVIFDPHEIHMNRAITKAAEGSKRMTAVFYYRKNMMYCGTPAQELKRARRNKGDNKIGSFTENLNKKNAAEYYEKNIKGHFDEVRYTKLQKS